MSASEKKEHDKMKLADKLLEDVKLIRDKIIVLSVNKYTQDEIIRLIQCDPGYMVSVFEDFINKPGAIEQLGLEIPTL